MALPLAGAFAVVEYSGRQSRSMVDTDIKTIYLLPGSQHEAITDLGNRVTRLEASADHRFNRVD